MRILGVFFSYRSNNISQIPFICGFSARERLQGKNSAVFLTMDFRFLHTKSQLLLLRLYNRPGGITGAKLSRRAIRAWFGALDTGENIREVRKFCNETLTIYRKVNLSIFQSQQCAV